MAKSVLAELVTKMTIESSQFKKELETTTARTVKFGKAQKTAANDAVFSNNKMSDAFRNAARSAATLQGPMGGISSRISVLATGFSSVGVLATAAGLALSGLAAITGLSVAKFAELEKRLLKTSALFKSTNGAAGLTTSELADLANEVAENTLASVAGVTQAINVLQTFKSISGETFTRTVELSQDLASVMGTDIKNASLQLGKALEDPITGLNSLRRSGVSFSESQKEVIKSLVQTGQVASAQKIILDTLQDQVGGTGAAEGAGLSGASDLLGQRWDEMLEQFALTTGVGATVTSALQGIAGAVESITGAIEQPRDIEGLTAEYEKLQKVIDSSRTRAPVKANARQEQNEIQEKIAALEAKNAAELEIIKQGQLDREMAIQAAKDRDLMRQQETGAKQLDALQKQVDSELEILLDRWSDRNEVIKSLVLSQEEIEARGYDNLLELQQDYYEKSGDLARANLDAIEQRKQKEVDSQLAMSASLQSALLSNGAALAGQIGAMAEEGSKASRAAFLAQQAIAIATTIITTEMAAMAALAPPPLGLGPLVGAPYAFGIRAIGYTSAALIGAQTIAGARELGGPVSGGKSYLVGEKGPELFTPSASGQITNNQNLQKVTGQSGANVVYSPTINGSGLSSKELFRVMAKDQKRFSRMVQSVMGVPA